MLLEFSIVPLGSGSSVGESVAEVLRLVDASGLSYKINPMGTVIEGEWDELFRLVRKCHMAVLRHEARVLTSIKIDDRKGCPDRLNKKVSSVEKRIGKKLRK